jgi:hypothetical protein
VFCSSPPALLVNKIEIAEARFLVGVRLEKYGFSREFVCRRDCIVAGRPALKGIRYVCAKKVWDAKQKR